MGKCYLILSQSIPTPKQHSDTYYISTQYDALTLNQFCASEVHFTSQKGNGQTLLDSHGNSERFSNAFYTSAPSVTPTMILSDVRRKKGVFKGEALPKCLWKWLSAWRTLSRPFFAQCCCSQFTSVMATLPAVCHVSLQHSALCWRWDLDFHIFSFDSAVSE